ncbi:MAG: helix-turn-helix domain-containing protein [Lachnospiraceae bacterium]|nr:helix-turn-helix domain-containing protein [Lachnospiraceae bacterium]
MKDRIKKIRKTLDLTQQEFADRIGIKRNSFANYETGRNTPIDAIIISICREFNVNENWLRTGEGEMYVEQPESKLDYSKIIDILVSLDTEDWQLLFDTAHTLANKQKKVINA